MNVVSLFSGAGGFDWGFHQADADFETILACEILQQPAETLAHNLNLEIVTTDQNLHLNGQGLMVQGDVRDLEFDQLDIQPDVLIGGPPCQDFSVTISRRDGERPGINGERGKLYLEFVRALMFLQPRMFVFENVPGLMSANNRDAYTVIQDDFRNLEDRRSEGLQGDRPDRFPENAIDGYELLYSDIVYPPHLGISQTRRRLIIIGLRQDLANQLGEPAVEEIRDQISQDLSGNGSLLPRYPLTALEIFEGQTLLELGERYQEIMQAYADLAEEPPNEDDYPNSVWQTWHHEIWNSLNFEIRHDYQFVNQIDNFTNAEFEQAMEEHAGILVNRDWFNEPVNQVNSPDHTNQRPRLKPTVVDRMYHIPPGQNYAFVDNTDWEVAGKNISFIYRRTDPLKPAWTVLAYGGGGTYGYHYERNRAQLTLRERARIQTFTDNFQFKGTGVRAQIGEAVPPLMGEKIAQSLTQILDLLDAN